MNSANLFQRTYFVKLCWTAAFEKHVHLYSIEQLSEFQSENINHEDVAKLDKSNLRET